MTPLLAIVLAASTPLNPVPVRSAPDAGSMVIVSDSASSATWKLLPSCVADGGNALNYNPSTRTFSCGAISGGGGGGGAPTTAQYWVGAADGTLSAEKNLGALATGLVVNTAGTPSAYAGASCTNQFPRSLNASGAATCASVVLGTDTTGNYVATPGGNTNEVQYKSGATTLGGMANFETDGTRPSVVPETSHPSAPASNALKYDFTPQANLPAASWSRDNLIGIPLPVGALSIISMSGTGVNWVCGSVKPTTWSTATLSTMNLGTPSGCSGTTAGNAWATTSLYTRSRVVTNNSASATNSSGCFRDTTTTSTGAWLGNGAGAGGFIYAHRFALDTPRANNRVAVGLFGGTAVLNTSADPNTAVDSVYVGCNSGDTNLSICSNDNSGNATCSTLGASYPCTTAGAYYDLVLFAPPNASSIYWYLERLDSAASTSGTLSSDLPRNSQQLSWQTWINTASGSTRVKIGLLYLAICLNY